MKTTAKQLLYKLLSAHADYIRAQDWVNAYTNKEDGTERLTVAKGKFVRAKKRYLEAIKSEGGA